MPPRIYLDHAATTPIRPAAKAAVAEMIGRWANPSSPHLEGRAARAALEEARANIKSSLSWKGDLIFTSGATEALQLALRDGERPLLVSAVEHDAVFRAAPKAEVLNIGSDGAVDRNQLADRLKASPRAVVAVQHVNSETGIEQPVGALAEQVRASGGILVSDCSQSAGKLPLPDADVIVLSAHKLGGPPGVGALLVNDLALLRPTGGQEQGYRAGTQNLPGACGMAAALGCVRIGLGPGRPADALPVADWLHDLAYPIMDLEYPLQLAGAIQQPSGGIFCPHILALTMPGVSAAAQLVQFDLAGIAVSAGSACSSGSLKTSRALTAFGVPEEQASCTIRVSFGWSTTAEEIRTFEACWKEIATRSGLRAS